jgi:glycosyltransferase involved in cell wall biosynthesis
MDESNSLLSHQVEAVSKLSSHYDNIFVLSGFVGEYRKLKNVTVVSTNWKVNEPLINILKFLFYFIKFYRKREFVGIFSHMTAVQSALIAPYTKIRGIRHVLWYAHTSNNFFLRWDALWVSKIVTSTKGSCPIKLSKVISIGQAINPEMFQGLNHRIESRISGIHVGRFDKSKNIELIMRVVKSLRMKGANITFTQVGDPSSYENGNRAESLIQKELESPDIWFKYIKGINRSSVPQLLDRYDFFLHAYIGSLDKSILEATILGLPVITINPEYIIQFGSWGSGLGTKYSLEDEIEAFLNMDLIEIREIVERRRSIALENHTLDNWVNGVVQSMK